MTSPTPTHPAQFASSDAAAPASDHSLLAPPEIDSDAAAIETPALVLDLNAAMRNIRRLQHAANKAGVKLRPHAKAHKCPDIARLQLAEGAVGICCQKVSEAIPFVAAGVRDIHISNEIVGPQKVRQLADLALHARMSVCVDHVSQIDALAMSTDAVSAHLGVFIEIDIGQHRCGVATLNEAVALAKHIAAFPQLEFRGLQAYHGGMQHKRGFDERKEMAAQAASRAAEIAQGLRDAGYPCETITGGGTGSAEFDFASGVFTEIQAGSYVFMDADYASNDYVGELHFEHSLFIAASVMSVAVQDQVVLDAGLKSMSVDSGLPWIWENAQRSTSFTYTAANDEHGIVRRVDHSGSTDDATSGELAPFPSLGAQVMLVPGHCDPTFNVYNRLVVIEQERVAHVWPIAARGMSW
jgi:D-serine deaminase-like pyridoxal phosphate-dependent protein